jgi:hypothetical protein
MTSAGISSVLRSSPPSFQPMSLTDQIPLTDVPLIESNINMGDNFARRTLGHRQELNELHRTTSAETLRDTCHDRDARPANLIAQRKIFRKSCRSRRNIYKACKLPCLLPCLDFDKTPKSCHGVHRNRKILSLTLDARPPTPNLFSSPFAPWRSFHSRKSCTPLSRIRFRARSRALP